MSWKKNIFSRLVCVVYLLVIGTAMAFTGSAICGSIGVAEYIGGIAAVAYLLLAGLIVYALRKTAAKLKGIPYSRGKVFLWIECILAVVLFAAGLFLRVGKMQADVDGSVFLDLAYVSSDGQTIPLFAHGAVYFYIWTLRLMFMLLGNKVPVALGLQIVLQMLGVLILYFAVRKMAGRVPAIMMLVFFMLSSYTAEKVIMLSPEMFYLLLFSIALLYASRGVDCVFGWLFWLFAGVMTALLVYLDVAGLLLIPLMLGVIVSRRKGAKRKIAGGMLGFAAGLLLGELSCVLIDALISSRSAIGIIEAWVQMYRFEEPRLAVTLSGFSTVWLIAFLLCFMAWGIFSSWSGRETERFSIWIICLLIAALMQCLGIFTEEMSGALYIFFFSTVLAGLSVKESIAIPEAESSEEGSNGVKAVLPELEVEELGEDEEEQNETGAGEEIAEVQTEQEKDEKKEKEEPESGAEAETADVRTEEYRQPDVEQKTTDKDRVTVEAENMIEEKQERKEAEQRVSEQEEQERKEAEQKASEKEETEQKQEIEYIENPLPLPKKHVKRVMDYALDSEPNSEKNLDGYDYFVSDDDDFDH